MTSNKLVYDVKGKVGGEEKSYYEMSDAEIKELMETERFSLTCAPGGENNRGMEIIGRMPIKGEGFTADDIEKLGPYFEKFMPPFMDSEKQLCFPKVRVLDLNVLSMDDTIDELDDADQARVLILRKWAATSINEQGWTTDVFKELASRRWDAEYLDPNKYRTEIKDGQEVKVRGKRMNKLARTNLCFVADREQEPAVFEGKGSIYDLNKMEALNKGVEQLRKQISDGLIEIGSKTKVEINVVEGNRYYNLKNTGIGFHGDTERVVVICISIGCDSYPMRWQWFKDGMPVGKPIDITLNCGDVYIMSEKAVGADWKLKSIYTLRHSAGAEKYRSLTKWEKKMPAYKAKQAAREEAKATAKAKKEAEAKLKKEAKATAKAKKEAEAMLKKEAKATKAAARALKTLKKPVDPEKAKMRKYKTALKKLNWGDNDADFYNWLQVQTEHECAPEHEFFKAFYNIWTGNTPDFSLKMDSKQWDEIRLFYKQLSTYRAVW